MITQAQKDDWIQALRSGEYQQGNGLLRSHADKYCCLGVLADRVGADWHQGGYGWTTPLLGDDAEYLSEEVLNVDQQRVLAAMNDGGKAFDNAGVVLADFSDGSPLSFLGIAEWIEANVKATK